MTATLTDKDCFRWLLQILLCTSCDFVDRLALQQSFHIFHRSPQHSSISALDDGSLNQVRMLDHKRNQLLVSKSRLAYSQFTVNRFAGAQQLTRGYSHFAQQFTQLLLRQRRRVVVHFFVINTALTEQSIKLAALCSSWFLVNYDLRAHVDLPPSNGTGASWEDAPDTRRFSHTINCKYVCTRS